jgi:hypothetical protein
MTQMSQTAICNRHHSLERRLWRLLLLSLYRVAGNALVMAQELIAIMLGVRNAAGQRLFVPAHHPGLYRAATVPGSQVATIRLTQPPWRSGSNPVGGIQRA